MVFLSSEWLTVQDESCFLSASTADEVRSGLFFMLRRFRLLREYNDSRSASASSALSSHSVFSEVSFPIVPMPSRGFPLRLSSLSPVSSRSAATDFMSLSARSKYSSAVTLISGLTSLIRLPERSSSVSAGRSTSALISDMELSERSSFLSFVHTESADISRTLQPERSSSVTLLLKVLPPSFISMMSSLASSL